MTLMHEPAVDHRNRLVAAWRAPLWAHLAALALILVAVMALLGTGSSFSADEGAALIQARSLADGRGWIVEHPAPEVDPTGVNYPLELSQTGTRGTAPFGKHPLYALLLAGADTVGGVTAMVLLSLAGAVAAAGLAGAVARRLDPALTRPTIWVVGIGSPLLVDGYLLIAHTVGAALAAAAVLAAIVAIERRSAALALAVMPALALCGLLRNEALFVAAAIAACAAVVGIRQPHARAAAALVTLGSLAAGAGAHVLDQRWTAHLVGGSVAAIAGAPARGATGLVAGRVQGFLVTWLTPSYGGHALTSLGLLVMLAAVVLCATTVRWHPEDSGRIVRWAAVAALAAVGAVVAGPTNVVPGLLLAFPLAAGGLLLVGRRTLRSDPAGIAAGVSVLFALAVLATQYAKGGGGEWGGRYFALVIPLYVPVLLLALRDQGARLAPAVARRAGAALVICSLALATMGVGALLSSHRANARLVASVDRAGLDAGGDTPIMVTTEGAMPRFAWSTFDRQRWLLATPEGVEDLMGRLRATQVDRVAFVTRDLARDRRYLDRAGVRVMSDDGSESARRWHVLVLRLS